MTFPPEPCKLWVQAFGWSTRVTRGACDSFHVRAMRLQAGTLLWCPNLIRCQQIKHYVKGYQRKIFFAVFVLFLVPTADCPWKSSRKVRCQVKIEVSIGWNFSFLAVLLFWLFLNQIPAFHSSGQAVAQRLFSGLRRHRAVRGNGPGTFKAGFVVEHIFL